MSNKNRRVSSRSVILGARLRNGDGDDIIAKIESEVRKAGGVLKTACADIDVPYRTLQNWRNEMPKVDEAVARGRVLEGQTRSDCGEMYKIIAIRGNMCTVLYDDEECDWTVDEVAKDEVVSE